MAANLPTNTHYEVGSAVVTAYPVTMACWFYVANTTTNRTLMDLGSTTGAHGQWLFVNSSAQVGWESRSVNSASSATTTATYSANTWHHACGIGAGNQDRRVFLDGGNKVTEGVLGRVFNAGIDRTLIGRRLRTNSATAPLTGRIAECAIWGVALSDDEVASLGRGYRPSLIRPESLVLYVPAIRDIIDVVGGNPITATGGTPTVIEHPRRVS